MAGPCVGEVFAAAGRFRVLCFAFGAFPWQFSPAHPGGAATPRDQRTWQSREGVPISRKALGCLVWSCAALRGRAPLSPPNWVYRRGAAPAGARAPTDLNSVLAGPVRDVSGFFCAQPLPAPGPTPLCASAAPLAPRRGGQTGTNPPRASVPALPCLIPEGSAPPASE